MGRLKDLSELLSENVDAFVPALTYGQEPTGSAGFFYQILLRRQSASGW